ncbi:hypothetical protein CEXT_635361 [Caerostris extrusa]|uniref:Uncharacterized protein n=1 Tax=Caerostris extrusa TaxID=172846 RepID=A0AAV4Y661_CAEEX|nr:hypothetical protein CEXT_635361 [Caerostris extrusa]
MSASPVRIFRFIRLCNLYGPLSRFRDRASSTSGRVLVITRHSKSSINVKCFNILRGPLGLCRAKVKLTSFLRSKAHDTSKIACNCFFRRRGKTIFPILFWTLRCTIYEHIAIAF